MTHRPHPLAAALVCLLAACDATGSATPPAPLGSAGDAGKMAPPSPAPADRTSAFNVRSVVPGAHIRAVQTLPAPSNPMAFEQGDFCGFFDAPPKTAGGKAALTQGWRVTSEAELMGYTSVGIFSRGSNGTSGTCYVEDGNIAIFRGSALVAIVYGDPPKPDQGGSDIGMVGSTLSPDRLRITDATPANFPLADLKFSDLGIEVLPIADLETACGSLDIPNLHKLDAHKARALLTPRGWTPAPQREAGEEPNPFLPEGMPEMSECSGTGYGFCSGDYRHTSGARLNLMTVGDDYTVTGYTVTCPKS